MLYIFRSINHDEKLAGVDKFVPLIMHYGKLSTGEYTEINGLVCISPYLGQIWFVMDNNVLEITWVVKDTEVRTRV